MNISDVYHLLGLVAVAVGATWALRSKLDDVKDALSDHAKEDVEKHAELENKIVEISKARRGRR